MFFPTAKVCILTEGYKCLVFILNAFAVFVLVYQIVMCDDYIHIAMQNSRAIPHLCWPVKSVKSQPSPLLLWDIAKEGAWGKTKILCKYNLQYCNVIGCWGVQAYAN